MNAAGRNMTDHTTPCSSLQECSLETKDRLTSIENELKDLTLMKKDIEKIAEVLTAWDNTKGFAITLVAIGKVLVFSVAVLAAILALKQYLSLGD